MKERLPALTALLLLIALVICTWWAAEYAQRAIPIDPPPRLTHEIDSWGRNFVMLRTDAEGRPINRMEGVYVEHYPDDDSYHVTSPRAIGQQANNPITIGTAKTAIMEQGGERIVMNGEAHIQRLADANNDRLDVRSEQLIIVPDEDIVFTDLPAVVLKGNSRMSGTGMRYNNTTRQLDVSASSDVEIAGSETRSRTQGGSNQNSNDQD